MSARVNRNRIEALHLCGLSESEIAVRLDCSVRTVQRWRATQRGTPLTRHPRVSEERLAAARRMIDDGASHGDIAVTLHMNVRTIARYFPGTSWSHENVLRYAHMVRQLNQIPVGRLEATRIEV